MKEFFAKYKIDEDVIAVGVSGGADSLALALLLQQAGKKVVALTVNHGLRKEAQDEAEYVAQIMAENKIEHHILFWQGEKPKKGIEEAAREARYNLLFDFCRQNDIKVLATGHHMRDQAETFLLRLARGSGVFGLSGILPVSKRQGIKIIRPLINTHPDEMKKFLLNQGIKWVEDPMNGDEDFLRVKMRKFLPELAKIGIDEKRLAQTAATLLKTREFIQKEVDSFVKSCVRNWDNVAVSLSWHKLKSLDLEISRRVLSDLICRIGNEDYAPKAEELERVLTEDDDFKGCTLGKCELLWAAKRLWIIPQDETNELMSKSCWDDFVEAHPQYKNAGLPYKVRRALWQNLKD